ncbi:MAG: glycoside hydrolase family 88 protein [Lachnospiraceae bacterium]|nr:glycoside hydrolase family 88 protein [Lachnospiraceae bacterium]
MIDNNIKNKINKYIDYLLENSKPQAPMWNIEKVLSGEPNKWNYIDGCMITAILSLYEMTGDEKYYTFAKDFVDYYVQEDGTIATYDPEEFNLDNVNTASNLFYLYDKTGDEKYRKAIELVRGQLERMPRTKEGNFWHKNIYPYQVWLDGMYMAQPFYMKYEMKFNGMKGCMDSIHQFENVERLMKDEKTGLYYHGYDESRQMYWANPETGCSANFWLRALGWFSVSLVETATAMTDVLYDEFRYLLRLLENLVEALIPYQDESGMFWQVVDHQGEEGNYLETSGTALIAYAILKAVRLGYLPDIYENIGVRALEGIIDRYLSIDDEGNLELGGICLVAGLGGKTRRDGSTEYYYSEPVVKNEAKGVAPLLLAYVELLRRG